MMPYAEMEIKLACEDIDRMKKTGDLELAVEVKDLCSELISDEMYGKHLTMENKIQARKACWGMFLTTEQYKERFLTTVLMQAYRPFDASHKNYFRLLKAIRKYNPEWEAAFRRRHDEWVKMLESRKVPIFIGTQ